MVDKADHLGIGKFTRNHRNRRETEEGDDRHSMEKDGPQWVEELSGRCSRNVGPLL